MARKRYTAEQIILKLREAEVSLAQGKAGTVKFTDFLEFPLIGVPAKSWIIHAG